MPPRSSSSHWIQLQVRTNVLLTFRFQIQVCYIVERIHFLVCVCTTDEEEDDEEVYKMAGVMAQCGGLECMLNRLSGIKDFKQGRHLLTVKKINLSQLTGFGSR